MNEDRIAKLSEGQRTCLRMVLMHHSSKDIGRALEISHHAVDQRLRVAMQILNVSSRLEAARSLAAYEVGQGATLPNQLYQSSVYQAPQLAPTSDPSIVAPLAEQREQLHEAAADAEPTPAPGRVANGFPYPFPTSGRTANDLTTGQRLLWIVAIAFFAALSFGTVITALETLSRVL